MAPAGRADADVNARDAAGRSALALAAAHCACRTVERLLAAGADARVADCSGRTPLHIAAQKGTPLHNPVPFVYVRPLGFGEGANPGHPICVRVCQSCCSGLHGEPCPGACSCAGTKVTVAALLKAGADPGAADACGATPRDLAAGAGHDRLLEVLPAEQEGAAERECPVQGADAPGRLGAAAFDAPGAEAQRSGAGAAAHPQPDQARGEADGAAQQRAPSAPDRAAAAGAAAAAAPAQEPLGGGGAAPARATLPYLEPDQEGQEDGEAALVDALAAELSARQAAGAALATERAERAAEAQVPRRAHRTRFRSGPASAARPLCVGSRLARAWRERAEQERARVISKPAGRCLPLERHGAVTP